MIKKSLLLLSFITSGVMAQDDFIEFGSAQYITSTDTLPYRLLSPKIPDPKRKYPLIVFLHGAGERGNDNNSQLGYIAPLFINLDNRLKFPCYVLAPQCPSGDQWAAYDRSNFTYKFQSQPTQAMQRLIELLGMIEKQYPIDTQRIYITGLSMGGFGTWDLLARFPKRFAAAVPICGGADLTTVHAFKYLPIWCFHGAKDSVVPVEKSREIINEIRRLGGKPKYTEYPDIDHNSWEPAFKEEKLLQWLFLQKSKP
ncbi:MAG: prolyl oligopeptidase family serine peptidase [Flammeovirgaceae bacterium]|nr:prolyl oligopeptidase family serine peptidase [Flammeovirgaceae bacterium]